MTENKTTRSWQLKDWKEKRKGILKDKCEWCGSIEKLLLHHNVNHSTTRHYKIREQVARFICKQMGVDVQPSAIYRSGGFGTKKGYVPIGEIRRALKEHQELIEEGRKQADDEYQSLANTITICKKCHFLYEMKGMRLCDSCKKSYHSVRHTSCYGCQKKIDEEVEELYEKHQKVFAEWNKEKTKESNTEKAS